MPNLRWRMSSVWMMYDYIPQLYTTYFCSLSSDRLRNFEKFKTNNLDTPYDYGSLMHFGMYVRDLRGTNSLIYQCKLGLLLMIIVFHKGMPILKMVIPLLFQKQAGVFRWVRDMVPVVWTNSKLTNSTNVVNGCLFHNSLKITETLLWMTLTDSSSDFERNKC